MPERSNKDIGRSPDSGCVPNLTPAISPTSANKTFSLTSAERIHLDTYGYVVLEGVLPKAKVDLLVETILQFEQDYQRDKVLPSLICSLPQPLGISSGLTIYPILLHVSATM